MYKGNTPKFTLRKLPVGIVSLGAGIVLMGASLSTTAYAEETAAEPSVATEATEDSSAETSEVTAPAEAVATETAETPTEVVEVAETDAPKEEAPATEETAEESTVKTPEVMTKEDVTPTEKTEEEKTTYSVNNDTPEKTVTDADKQINKDNKDLFEVKRDVTVDDKGEVTVTTTVTPKEIDHGAEVIVLLDTSRKMLRAENGKALESAKEKIATLVQTLTGSSDPLNSRNAVRLITFDKHVDEAVELNPTTVTDELNKISTKAESDNQYGVALQAAIHKARGIFERERQTNPNKRQHIVLFSQGEATFSYDVADKDKLRSIKDKSVTYSNPVWPFYFDTSVSRGNIVDDGEYYLDLIGKTGLGVEGLKSKLAAGKLANLLGFIIENPLDYLTLKEVDSSNAKTFDYNKTLGEGYNYRSYNDFKHVDNSGVLDMVKKELKKSDLSKSDFVQELKKYTGLLPFGIGDLSNEQIDTIMEKVIDQLFHGRQYTFSNHNLSAQGEAKLAQESGIKFYSVDVTEKDDFKKFDTYLKAMSEKGKLLEVRNDDLSLKNSFKDRLTGITITDKLGSSLDKPVFEQAGVTYEDAKDSWLFGKTDAKLTWKISEAEAAQAFSEGKALTFTYTVKAKADVKPGKVITSTADYTINNEEGKSASLGAISLDKTTTNIETQHGGVIELDSHLEGMAGKQDGDLTTTEDTMSEEPKVETPEETPKEELKPEAKLEGEKETPEESEEEAKPEGEKETPEESEEEAKPEGEKEAPEESEEDVKPEGEKEAPKAELPKADDKVTEEHQPKVEKEGTPKAKDMVKPLSTKPGKGQAETKPSTKTISQKALPETGDKEAVLAALIGIELVFTAGLLHKKRNEND